MTKQEFAKFLETATDCQLAAISAVIEGKENPAVKAAQDAQATAEAALKTATDGQAAAVEAAVKAANEAAATAQEAAIKAAVDAVKEAPEYKAAMELATAKKTATIKALMETKRCDKTEEQLKALSQAELDSMIKLAGSKPVDYSGQAAHGVDAGQEQTVPAAPDTVAAIKAANAKK